MEAEGRADWRAKGEGLKGRRQRELEKRRKIRGVAIGVAKTEKEDIKVRKQRDVGSETREESARASDLGQIETK